LETRLEVLNIPPLQTTRNPIVDELKNILMDKEAFIEILKAQFETKK
jgi:hypothetical protein